MRMMDCPPQIRRREERREIEEIYGKRRRGSCYTGAANVVAVVWKHTFAKVGEDWVFLAVLGVVMAVVSFLMDWGISTCNTSRYSILGIRYWDICTPQPAGSWPFSAPRALPGCPRPEEGATETEGKTNMGIFQPLRHIFKSVLSV